MRTRRQGPPLYIETKSAFVEEEKKSRRRRNFFGETMTRDENGTSYEGKEIIKSMEPILEYMNKNIMKGFKFLSIQSWEKYIDFKKTKGKNASACLKEQKEETHEPPSYEIGEVDEVVHEEDINSLPNDFEKYEETSQKKEEEYLETIEYHSETNSAIDMDQRAFTDGCLNY